MVDKQKVIFTITQEEDQQKINLSFEPELCGSNKFEEFTNVEKHLQDTAARIGGHVMDALKAEDEEGEK